jgi:hypothetical protein
MWLETRALNGSKTHEEIRQNQHHPSLRELGAIIKLETSLFYSSHQFCQLLVRAYIWKARGKRFRTKVIIVQVISRDRPRMR